jgi:SsrA-binding protein
MKPLAENRRARFDYQILETFEAGIILEGHEVKAIKLGRASLGGSYVILKNQEVFLLNANVSPYQPNNTPKNYDRTRTRKLLLNKKEIRYLIGKSQQRGLTLIPLKLYTREGKIKLEFGVARGTKKVNKKEIIRKKDIEREIDRELKIRG